MPTCKVDGDFEGYRKILIDFMYIPGLDDNISNWRENKTAYHFLDTIHCFWLFRYRVPSCNSFGTCASSQLANQKPVDSPDVLQ